MDTTATITAGELLTSPEATQSLSILELASKGGWIMIVLLVLSILSLYIFIKKVIQIQRAGKEDRYFMARVHDFVHEGKTSSAIKLCQEVDTPSARMIQKGLSRLGKPMNDILVIIENVGSVEIGRMQKGLPILATVAAVAPMIGFLGTVTGMIRAFFDMASNGQAALDISLLSGGIYEALVTTVAGLIVGICALVAYNYCVAQLDKVINKMESQTIEFMDILNH